MDNDTKRQLLKDEYLHLQNVIEGFDGRALTIKAWSISFSLAALAGAFASHSTLLLLIASLSTLLFWIIEGYWKTFQYAYYSRIGKIEKYFENESEDILPMQIGANWYKHWKAGGNKRLVRIMFWPHVALPHVAIFLIGVALYILETFKIIKI
jgi:hypothetical protein